MLENSLGSQDITQQSSDFTEPNETKISQTTMAWRSFLGGLESGLNNSTFQRILQQFLSLFSQFEQEALFFEGNQQSKTSVLSYYLLEDKLLEDKLPDPVLEDMISSDPVNQRGFEVTEKEIQKHLAPVTCYKNDNHYQFDPYLCRPQH